MKRLSMILIAAVMLAGCTTVTYERDGVRLTYRTMFTEKSLAVQTQDAKGQSVRVRFDTNSDPAVAAFKDGLAAAGLAGTVAP